MLSQLYCYFPLFQQKAGPFTLLGQQGSSRKRGGMCFSNFSPCTFHLGRALPWSCRRSRARDAHVRSGGRQVTSATCLPLLAFRQALERSWREGLSEGPAVRPCRQRPPDPRRQSSPARGKACWRGACWARGAVWFPLNSHYLLTSGTMLRKAAVAT